jgi:3D (Asp-Asp-Asp) domain-containing protein
VAALVAAWALALLAATAGAGSSGGGQAARLSREADAYASRARSAALELYSVESELSRTRARLGALEANAARLRSRRDAVRLELDATRRSLAKFQRLVAVRLRTLYEQGDVDPLTVLLGSSSLDQALSRIDALDRLTRQSETVVDQAAGARRSLGALSARLAARSAELASLTDDAQRSASALAASRAEHLSLISALHAHEQADRGAVARLDASAREASAQSSQLAAVTSNPEPPPAAANGSTLTVLATGYAIQGRTATGVPTGWGVAAVDPSLIPLGTRIEVPGYGEAVAADVGGAVQGAVIDLWFPTQAQAQAWGRRTITITIG